MEVNDENDMTNSAYTKRLSGMCGTIRSPLLTTSVCPVRKGRGAPVLSAQGASCNRKW
jgi:hypothetical protein